MSTKKNLLCKMIRGEIEMIIYNIIHSRCFRWVDNGGTSSSLSIPNTAPCKQIAQLCKAPFTHNKIVLNNLQEIDSFSEKV